MSKEEEVMVTPITWKEFRESKMLWWVNRLLHTFGLSIVVELDDNDRIVDVYPARVKFRGFPTNSEEAGFKGVSQFIVDNATELKIEADS